MVWKCESSEDSAEGDTESLREDMNGDTVDIADRSEDGYRARRW